MTDTNLTNTELSVLEHLSDTPQTISQREIARRSGLSVGLINAILKKLVHTGYVKTSHLNRRSIQYLLTPEGFSEKARKSYHYVLDTVRRYRSIQVRFTSLLEQLAGEGVTEFYLQGEGELADIVELLFREEGFGVIHRGTPPERRQHASVVLNASAQPMPLQECRVINLTHELSEMNTLCSIEP